MKLIETVHSRYGVPRRIFKIGEDHYRIVGESYYLRIGGKGPTTEDPTSLIDFIDFEGGPFISVNSDEWIGGKVITKIEKYVDTSEKNAQMISFDLFTEDPE